MISANIKKIQTVPQKQDMWPSIRWRKLPILTSSDIFFFWTVLPDSRLLYFRKKHFVFLHLLGISGITHAGTTLTAIESSTSLTYSDIALVTLQNIMMPLFQTKKVQVNKIQGNLQSMRNWLLRSLKHNIYRNKFIHNTFTI